MNKKEAFQVSAEEVKHLQANKKLFDQVYFRSGEDGKFKFSDKPFGTTKGSKKPIFSSDE